MHKNLRSFIDTLRAENEIVEISAEVDPYLEIAEIHRRVIEEQGKALLFKNVKGSGFPVVTNLFGTKRRIDLAFGPRPEEFVRRAVHMVEDLVPPKAGAPPIVCLAGANACPPEDVGGSSGYAEFLEVLADPTHEEHASMLAWAGGAFDPTAFDIAEINTVLATIKP